MSKIPRVKFEINPDDKMSGVKVMSLVDQPAIESDFIFFNKTKSNYIELKSEKYKQVVAGLALIPDKDILRFDSNGNQYYGYFTKEVIEEIRDKFHKEGTNTVNTDHDSTNYVDAYMLESFIIDSEDRLKDVKSKGIDEATIGSWFVAYKIEDAATFERVIKAELKGFSVEIFLSKFYKRENNFNKEVETIMNKFLEKFKQLLAEAEQEETKKFETAKTADGKEVQYTTEGEAVTIDGKPAEDGEYVLDNGKTITVASGVAAKIADSAPVEEQKKVEEPAKASEAEVKFQAEIAALKVELEKSKADAAKAVEELEKFKKAPLVQPIVKTELKKSKLLTQDEFNELSNVDKILYKKGLYESK